MIVTVNVIPVTLFHDFQAQSMHVLLFDSPALTGFSMLSLTGCYLPALGYNNETRSEISRAERGKAEPDGNNQP